MADGPSGAASTTSTTSDAVLTVPNVLSVLRLCCIPVFLYLLFGRENRAAAGWVLGVLGATDFVDGTIARRFDQVSELGKVLDPVADRLLIVVGVGAILVDGSAPRWFGALVLAREGVVALAGLLLASLGARRIDVTWWGKAGTFATMFAFPLWLGGNSTLSYAPFVDALAWVFAVPGLVLSYVALALYVPIGRQALEEGRAERAARRAAADRGPGRRAAPQ